MPPRTRSRLILRPMGEEWVLYDPETRDLHALNVAAALTWSLLDGERTLEEVAAVVHREMQQAPDLDVVADHVRDTVASFVDAGLLESE